MNSLRILCVSTVVRRIVQVGAACFAITALTGCGRKGFRGDVRAAGMTAMSLSDALPGGLTACGGARQRRL